MHSNKASRSRKPTGANGQSENCRAVRVPDLPQLRVCAGVSLFSSVYLDAETAMDELTRVAEAAFARLSHGERGDNEAVEGSLMRAVRKAAEKLWGKRPLVDVNVLRV